MKKVTTMKGFLVFAVLALSVTPASAGNVDVGVSIAIGEPGFYGRIDIGNYPQPRLIFPQPVLVEQVLVVPEPVYLYVPRGHAVHWDQYCYEYNACGRPVYFVEADWYEQVYVPAYRQKHGGHGKGKKSKSKGRS